MAHLGARAFEEIGGEVVQTTAFVMQNRHVHGFKGMYARLIEPTTQDGKEEMFLDGENRFSARQDNFERIPGAPVAYWVSENVRKCFEYKTLGDIGTSSKGIITGDNNRFLRLWYETQKSNIEFSAEKVADAQKSNKKWYPCRKGGEMRKWYGNNEYIINWKGNGYEVLGLSKKEKRNCQDYLDKYKFIPSISWTSISSGTPSFRFGEKDLSESAGMSYFVDSGSLKYNLALMNSCVSINMLSLLAPTMNYTAGAINRLPIIQKNVKAVEDTTNVCISLSKEDWDSFETSWDFKKHPLI